MCAWSVITVATLYLPMGYHVGWEHDADADADADDERNRTQESWCLCVLSVSLVELTVSLCVCVIDRSLQPRERFPFRRDRRTDGQRSERRR